MIPVCDYRVRVEAGVGDERETLLLKLAPLIITPRIVSNKCRTTIICYIYIYLYILYTLHCYYFVEIVVFCECVNVYNIYNFKLKK